MASSMGIEVCYSQKRVKVKVTPWTSVQQLKEIMHQKEGVNVHEQTLFCNNRQLQDRNTLMDYGIKKDAVVHLMIRRLGGCFSQDSLVTKPDGKLVRIGEVKVGDKVMAFEQKFGIFGEDEVTGVHEVKVHFRTIIKLSDGQQIECTPQDLFLTATGEWKKC